MPTTVLARFDVEGAVELTPQRLHAALSRIFDLPEGISPERARHIASLAHRPVHQNGGVKPYSLGEVAMVAGELNVEVRFLDDRLVDTFDAWLAWGGVLTIGDGGARTAHLVGVGAQIMKTSTWEELADTPTATVWDVEFLTPTVFSARSQHRRGVTPAMLASSLQNRWWANDPVTCPSSPSRELINERFDYVSDFDPVPVNLSQGRRDRRGRLASDTIEAYQGRMRIFAPADGWYAAEFSSLMALAAFSNVGSHSSFGLGVIQVVTLD